MKVINFLSINFNYFIQIPCDYILLAQNSANTGNIVLIIISFALYNNDHFIRNSPPYHNYRVSYDTMLVDDILQSCLFLNNFSLEYHMTCFHMMNSALYFSKLLPL